MSKREPAHFTQILPVLVHIWPKIRAILHFFWTFESTFQLFFINLDVFLWPKEHKMHLESPNQFFWTFEKKTSFFGLFVAIFLKIAVKSWIFPPKSCFIKKHMSFRSKQAQKLVQVDALEILCNIL